MQYFAAACRKVPAKTCIPALGGLNPGRVSTMRFVRKINERGTLTIPSEVREVLDLKDGDIVDVQIVRVVGRGKKAFPGEVAEDEVALRGRVAAEVHQVRVAAELDRDARRRRSGEV